MKKYLSVLFLIVFIVPSVAFASWWNPFSWSIFHRVDKTQILENHVSNSEKKEDKITTTSSISILNTATTTSTSKPSPKVKKTIISPPKPPIPSSITIPVVTPQVESWEQLESENYIYANQMGWTAMFITHPTTGEKRYYRKEDTKWVRKNSEYEAVQPYQSATQPVLQPVAQPTQTIDPITQPSQNITTELENEYTTKVTEWATNYKNMQAELVPYEEQIAVLKTKEKEVGCDIIDMSRIIGSIAQQCNVLLSQEGVILGKEGVVMAKYGYYGTTATNRNFNTQQSISGQNYTFYYNGYGSGTVYNNSNPADNYKIYCNYGKCDIYGN